MDVVLVKGGQAAQLTILDLPLVVPVLHVAVVVVPAVLVVVEIGDQVAVIVELALAHLGRGRTVIADDIEDEFHLPLMQFLDQRIENGVLGEKAHFFRVVDPARIDPFEILRPIPVQRRYPGGIALDLLKKRRKPKSRHAEIRQVIEFVDHPLDIASPILFPIGAGRIVERRILADIILRADIEAVSDNKIDRLPSDFFIGKIELGSGLEGRIDHVGAGGTIRLSRRWRQRRPPSFWNGPSRGTCRTNHWRHRWRFASGGKPPWD